MSKQPTPPTRTHSFPLPTLFLCLVSKPYAHWSTIVARHKMFHIKSTFAEELHTIMPVLTHLIVSWSKRPLVLAPYPALPRLRYYHQVGTKSCLQQPSLSIIQSDPCLSLSLSSFCLCLCRFSLQRHFSHRDVTADYGASWETWIRYNWLSRHHDGLTIKDPICDLSQGYVMKTSGCLIFHVHSCHSKVSPLNRICRIEVIESHLMVERME
jgi:hypothetical protein